MAGRKRKRNDGGDRPRRGMRRSIRFVESESGEKEESGRDPDRPPEILLRKLRLVEALERLEFQLQAYAAKDRTEVLVVHGKGQSSERGIPVLGPEVRRWCGEHPELVASWQEAPGRWGGAGAIVVRLRTD